MMENMIPWSEVVENARQIAREYGQRRAQEYLAQERRWRNGEPKPRPVRQKTIHDYGLQNCDKYLLFITATGGIEQAREYMEYLLERSNPTYNSASNSNYIILLAREAEQMRILAVMSEQEYWTAEEISDRTTTDRLRTAKVLKDMSIAKRRLVDAKKFAHQDGIHTVRKYRKLSLSEIGK